MAHLLALLHVSPGFLLEGRAAPWHTHDMAEVATLQATRRPEDVLVGDRACCACAPLALLRQQGRHAVLRVQPRHMGDGTPSRPHTTPTPSAAPQGLPRSRWLRQVGGTDPRGEWVQPVPWVTPLLEVDLSPADAWAALYHMRWQGETHLRHLTQTLGLEVLHCPRLVGSLQELPVFAVVDTLVRMGMLAAAQRQGVALERRRVVEAWRWLRTARPGDPFPPLVGNPHRPDRVEPRAVKRRPKPYPLLMTPRRVARNALIQQPVGA